MKKINIKILLFTIFSFFTAVSIVNAADTTITTNISFGETINFISGIKYDNVNCSYSGDTQNFEFTQNNNTGDYYVDMTNPGVTTGSATAVCSYSSKSAMQGNNLVKVSGPGTDTFIFNIALPEELNQFVVDLHRQFRYFVDLKNFFKLGSNVGLSEIVLSGDLVDIFGSTATCNSQNCSLTLKQNATPGTHVGTIKYGQWEFEMVVNVSEEWTVYANSGLYGVCNFGEEGWERSSSNLGYYEKTITTQTVQLPQCGAGTNLGNRYAALEFVGWVYNKDSLENNYNGYQSIDICATYADGHDSKIGFIAPGTVFSPGDLTYNAHGNSIFYSCYKTNGIGFNLLGVTIEDDTYGIKDWELSYTEGDVFSSIYYKVFNDGTTSMTLPSNVKASGLDQDEVFVGWAHNKLGYDGTNVDVLIPGGTSVSVEEGLIYTPQFMIQRSETERQITVYKDAKYTLELPSGFTCPSVNNNDYYSIVGSGNKCVITGKKSTNGSYLNHQITSGSRVYTAKIQVIESTYGEDGELPGIVIGDGELILDPNDDSSGNSSIKVPADCESYLVGRPTSGASRSSDLFEFTNAYGFHRGHINTYYARSNCMGSGNHALETEYAALCLDPGRAGPPRSRNALAKDGSAVSVTEYKFYRYINTDDENEAYRTFSRAVAFIVSDINGRITLAQFNEANNKEKIAANIALRIIATKYDTLSARPDEGSSGNEDGQTISYFSAYQAYQSMAQHLNGHFAVSDSRVYARPENNGQTDAVCNTNQRSMYMTCNSEWNWIGDSSLLEKVADYLNFAYGDSAPSGNWEITPKMYIPSYGNFDGHDMTVVLEYPHALDAVNYKVYFNISEEMSKYYQIDLNQYPIESVYNWNKQFTCEPGYEKNNKCLRYRVIIPPDSSGGGAYVNLTSHTITLHFAVDTSNGVAFPDPDSRDIYFEVAYSSTYTAESAFMVEPIVGARSIQRMVLFNPEEVMKIFPLSLYDCNILLQQHGNNPSMYQAIYNAGCCETISDGSTEYQEFVNTYCKRDCVMNNYKPVCEASDTVTDYKIKEAMTQGGNINYRCVVDATKLTSSLSVANQLNMINGSAVSSPSPYQNTSSMKDITGQNSIAIADYNNNPYCRVTCKEDWSFNMPGYNDFLGANAVAAGSVFQINHSIKLSSTVTCVTSYIDIDGYKAALTDRTSKMYDAYLSYSLRAAAHKDITVTSINKGTWYTYDEELKNCGADEFDSNGNNPEVSTCSWNRSYSVPCDGAHIGQGTCTISGSYKVNPNAGCSKTNSSSSDCVVGGTYTYTRACTYADGSAGGCRPRPIIGCRGTGEQCTTWESGGSTYTGTKYCTNGDSNHDGCTVDYKTASCLYSTDVGKNGCTLSGEYSVPCYYSDVLNPSNTNCKFSGQYKKITQATHSGDGDGYDTACMVYKIVTNDVTKVQSHNLDGSNGILRTHSGINGKTSSGQTTSGYAITEYTAGSSDVCGYEGECKKTPDTVANDYICEVNSFGSRNDSDFWKNRLITTRTYYGSDSNLIRNEINGYYTTMNGYMDDIIKVSNAFAKCQNFNINNTTAGTSGYNIFTQSNGTSAVYSATNGVVLNGTVNKVTSSYNIATKLEPGGTFGYDEDYYMSLMGNNRVIDRTTGISLSYKTEMYPSTSVSSNFASCYGADGNYTDASGTYPCSSTITSSAGVINSDSKNVVDNLLNIPLVLCNLSSGYNYDAGDKCGTATFYYYNANYIKKSLTSSADYDNKITWYRYLANDTLYPGVGFASVTTKQSVATTVNGGNYNPNDWTVVGTKNVFPVSLNTRRNIYQYYYSFKGIGNYYNNSRVEANNIGRIMGYDNSVIKNNARICFYEVYESACICCGANDIGPVSETNKVNSYAYVPGYRPSTVENGSGHYGFNASAVSLYNINGTSTSSNAANWNAGERYFYNGSGNYTTDKGKELADYIEAKGENAYSEVPDYSYVLTPNAMANIRKLNSSAAYGYGKDTVYQENGYAYLVKAGSKNGHAIASGVDVADQIIFTHYGSKFVRDKLSAYETPEYKDKLLSNKGMNGNCYVEAGNVNQLNNLRSADCKWVDYVQTVGSSAPGQYFRMAFK